MDSLTPRNIYIYIYGQHNLNMASYLSKNKGTKLGVAGEDWGGSERSGL